jgi:negative regulator of sigma E activity
VINEEVESQLSAMFDGQLPGTECELLSRRLGREEPLRSRWARYAVIGAVMRSEPVAAARSGFAGRVSAAIAADAQVVPQRAAGGARLAWRLGVGSALVAGVAAMSVLALRQYQAPADEVVIAQTPGVLHASPGVVEPLRPQALPPVVGNGEPESYVVPPAGSGGQLAPPAELANYVVAHSAYSTPLMRRNLLSALVSGDAAEAEAQQTTSAPDEPAAP